VNGREYFTLHKGTIFLELIPALLPGRVLMDDHGSTSFGVFLDRLCLGVRILLQSLLTQLASGFLVNETSIASTLIL
jgi:hypothetical protein